MSVEDDLPLAGPTDERNGVGRTNHLYRTPRQSPGLDKEYRTSLHSAMPAKDGAPRGLKDLPNAVRLPTKPPGRETKEDRLRAVLTRLAHDFPEHVGPVARGTDEQGLQRVLAGLAEDGKKPDGLRKLAREAAS
jgi:hypothetical protein